MFGYKYVGSLYNDGVQPMTRKFKITAATVVTKGDAVALSSGKLISGTDVDGAKLVGIANETVTGNAAGTNTCEIIVAKAGDLYLADTDASGSFAATQVGTYFDQGNDATGAHQIADSTTGTTGTWLLVEHNPQGYGLDSDVSIGLFSPAETIFDGRTA
jgi:hypothetical protein